MTFYRENCYLERMLGIATFFFASGNEFANWKMSDGRAQMDPYWKEHGKLIRTEKTTRVEIPGPNGSIGYVYWLRQNPRTDEIYYVTYGGTTLESFCRLQKNAP